MRNVTTTTRDDDDDDDDDDCGGGRGYVSIYKICSLCLRHKKTTSNWGIMTCHHLEHILLIESQFVDSWGFCLPQAPTICSCPSETLMTDFEDISRTTKYLKKGSCWEGRPILNYECLQGFISVYILHAHFSGEIAIGTIFGSNM